MCHRIIRWRIEEMSPGYTRDDNRPAGVKTSYKVIDFASLEVDEMSLRMLVRQVMDSQAAAVRAYSSPAGSTYAKSCTVPTPSQKVAFVAYLNRCYTLPLSQPCRCVQAVLKLNCELATFA